MAEENGSAETGNPAPEAAPEAPAAAPAPTPTSPMDSFADAELRDYAVGKGFDKSGLEGAVKSYKHLEKLVSGGNMDSLVQIPGPEASPEAMGEFYSKLGRPMEATGYELPTPEGSDGAMAEWASGVFHEAGLTQKQAQVVAQKWNEYTAGLQTDAGAEAQQSAERAEAELRREWGAAYDQKAQGIETAATQLGMTAEQLVGLRDAMGPAAAMRFVDGLAGKLGEDVMDNGEAKTGGLMTPNAAMEEMARLGSDQDFMAAWMDKSHPSHQWAVDKKASLARMAAGVAA